MSSEVTPWLQDRGEDDREGYHLDRILVPISSLSGWAIVLVGILASLQVGAACPQQTPKSVAGGAGLQIP